MIDAACTSLLIDWFGSHGRIYPWRQTDDPYRVLVATFMLQRTGVGQVMNVYPEFIRRFPDLASLAAAPADEIGRAIRPLGRVGRVGQLLQLVGAIQKRHGGAIPRDLDALEALPGLGQYSARSVMCMAWGKPFIMLDPNSYRVLVRACGVRSNRPRPHTDLPLIRALDAIVPGKAPRDFNLALLDVGSTICRSRKPRHSECPLSALCLSAGGET